MSSDVGEQFFLILRHKLPTLRWNNTTRELKQNASHAQNL
jgi:hypothetical protein